MLIAKNLKTSNKISLYYNTKPTQLRWVIYYC